MPTRTLLALVLALASLQAQEPLANPSPFAPAEVPAAGRRMLSAATAERALQAGFSSIAASAYRELLADPALSVGERNALILKRVTALLDGGRAGEAERALEDYLGDGDEAYRLRAALVAAATGRYDFVRSELATLRPETLSSEDRGWYYFLQGRQADAARDFAQAREYYRQAAEAATADLQRARFVLAREQARLFLGEATEEQAAQQRQLMERFGGTSAGYAATSQYAVTLNALGRKSEAVELLRRALPALPAGEQAAGDEFRLLLGLIAGAQDGVGRNALENLLARAGDRDKQRVALQLLAGASLAGTPRERFRVKLSELIDTEEDHPILEDLLLFRAELALDDKAYAQAEADAKALLAAFPGSELKPAALGILVSTAWEERHRYRMAADYARQARAVTPPGEARAELGVLIAEAYFRAGDFQNAAEGYAAALQEAPAGVSLGSLMFQRVLSEIEGGHLDAAQILVDAMAEDSRFASVDRWQAEWNLARSLQVAGRTKAAFDRVNRLLSTAEGAAELPPELRVRMAWLQARLSFEAGAEARTQALAEALLQSLDGIDETLRREIASTTRLLQAEANFRLQQIDTALTQLATLRSDYPQSAAAVYSYIAEANYYAEQNQLVDAQRLLTKLADDYKGSNYAPYALYQAALNAERRGQDAYYQEAYTILERLVREYPQSDLVFYARLEQGALLRRLNQFGQAQQVYELLVNSFPQHRDVLLAELALAACHRAQAVADSSHVESALTLFERLQDLPTAPLDLRVEAGFQRGDLLAQRGNVDRARAAWWELVEQYLTDDTRVGELGAKGRFWIARVLAQLGASLDQDGLYDEAKRAYRLIVERDLPGAALARQKLAQGVVTP